MIVAMVTYIAVTDGLMFADAERWHDRAVFAQHMMWMLVCFSISASYLVVGTRLMRLLAATTQASSFLLKIKVLRFAPTVCSRLLL